MKGLLGFALAQLDRRRVRTLALGTGLFCAATLLAAAIFLVDALRAEAERMHASMPDLSVQSLLGGRPTTIPVERANDLRDIPSVADVRARVWGYVFLPALSGNATIVGVSDAAIGRGDFGAVIAEGRDLGAGEDAHEMVAGKRLAEFMGLRLGDELGLPSVRNDVRSLRLVGTFTSDVEHYAVDVIFMREDDARRVLGLPDGVATDFAIRAKNPEETQVIARTVTERLPGVRVIDKQSLLRVHYLTYGRRAGLLLLASLPALFALLVLVWERATGLTDADRRDIAIWKSVGFSTRDVLYVKMFEAIFLAPIALVLGLTAAYAWVFVLGAPGLRAALTGWSVLYPASPLTPAIDPGALLGIAIVVIGPFVGMSVVPAWRAAITDPMEVMRG